MKCAKPHKRIINLENLKYKVVRVADEVVVDLMGSACGIDFKSAQNQIEVHEIDGVKIPFASAELMLKAKQTL